MYSSKGFVLYALVAYAFSFYEGILPASQNFIVSYRILNGDEVIKKDVLSKNYNQPFVDAKSDRQKLTAKYVCALRAEFDVDCNRFIGRIIDEL
jgi:hypothetical protein